MEKEKEQLLRNLLYLSFARYNRIQEDIIEGIDGFSLFASKNSKIVYSDFQGMNMNFSSYRKEEGDYHISKNCAQLTPNSGRWVTIDKKGMYLGCNNGDRDTVSFIPESTKLPESLLSSTRKTIGDLIKSYLSLNKRIKK